MRVDIPTLNTPRIYVHLDNIGVGAQQIKGRVVGRLESYFHTHEEEPHLEPRKIVVTSPKAKDVIVTQQYVCQIHSQRHINVRALENGYLEEIPVKEGQAVKKGDLMFKIVPILYQAKLDAELAEAELAQLEFNQHQEVVRRQGSGRRERGGGSSRPNWPRPRPRRIWRRPN